MKKGFSIFLCVLLASMLAACSGGADSSDSSSTSEQTEPKVTLDKQSLSMPIDGTYTLIATVEPEDKDAKVTWVTSDEKSVTVKDGLVTAIAPGKFTVVATVEGSNRARCIVTVREPLGSDASNSDSEDSPDGADADATQDGTAPVDTDAWHDQGHNGGYTQNPQAPPPAQPQAPAQTPHTPVWIVTQHAWTEQVPIYENQPRAICSNCGADITDVGATYHMKNVPEEQKLAGCGTWHTQYRDTLVGHQEIHHPEQGYWQ